MRRRRDPPRDGIVAAHARQVRAEVDPPLRRRVGHVLGVHYQVQQLPPRRYLVVAVVLAFAVAFAVAVIDAPPPPLALVEPERRVPRHAVHLPGVSPELGQAHDVLLAVVITAGLVVVVFPPDPTRRRRRRSQDHAQLAGRDRHGRLEYGLVRYAGRRGAGHGQYGESVAVPNIPPPPPAGGGGGGLDAKSSCRRRAVVFVVVVVAGGASSSSSSMPSSALVEAA